MVYEEIDINNASVGKILKTIQHNCDKTRQTRREIEKFKTQIHELGKEEIVEEEIVDFSYEEDIDDTKEYNKLLASYLDKFHSLPDGFTEEDLKRILPERDSYFYSDVINYLMLDTIKSKKEIMDFMHNDHSLSKEEKEECIRLIVAEDNKKDLLELVLEEEDELGENNAHNHLILDSTSGGNIRLLEQLSSIPQEYYHKFLILVKSIENGSFKGNKPMSGNSNLSGLWEVKLHKVRIIYKRLNENDYVLLGAFVKKFFTDKHYNQNLERIYLEYLSKESRLQQLATDLDFVKENDNYVEELYRLLGQRQNNDNYQYVKEEG